jgi:hypothetical protein
MSLQDLPNELLFKQTFQVHPTWPWSSYLPCPSLPTQLVGTLHIRKSGMKINCLVLPLHNQQFSLLLSLYHGHLHTPCSSRLTCWCSSLSLPSSSQTELDTTSPDSHITLLRLPLSPITFMAYIIMICMHNNLEKILLSQQLVPNSSRTKLLVWKVYC